MTNANFARDPSPIEPDSGTFEISPAIAADILLRRRHIRRNLIEWCRHCGYEPAPHHRLLIDRLERVARGEIKRLAVFMPPGSAKSTYGSILFPPYVMANAANRAILAASHTTELAEKWGRRVRNLIAQHGATLGLRLSDDSHAAGRWELDNGGEYYAAGVGTAIVGFRANLSKTKGRCNVNGKVQTVEYNPKDEIEMGISAVHWAVGGPTAPYFRFPALRQPPELIEYLGKRNIGIFSTDMDSFDFKMRKPEQVRQSVMEKLKKHGKGIVLVHDFQHATAEAAMDLLNDLKAGGYKVVFMQPKFAVTTIAAYDETILKQVKGSGGGDARPTSTVVRTISE
jgi:hypothetical protein